MRILSSFPRSSVHTSLSEVCKTSNWHILVYQRLYLSFLYAENSSSPFCNISVYPDDTLQKGYYIHVRMLPYKFRSGFVSTPKENS